MNQGLRITTEAVILLLFVIGVSSSPLRAKRQGEQCPVPYDSLWQQNSRNCPEGQVYHCLEDEDGAIIDGCFAAKVCLKGARPVYEGNTNSIECRQCPSGTFQPQFELKTDRTTSSVCEDHSPCKADYHKIECREGTVEKDVGCMCDSSQGYEPVGSDCGCFTVDDGCSCYFTQCPNGTQRNGAGRCVLQTTKLPPDPTTTTTPTPMPPQPSTDPTASDGIPDYGIGLIIVGVILLTLLALAVAAWRNWKRLKSWCLRVRYKSPSPPVGPVVLSKAPSYSVQLSWSPPSYNGGIPINYIVELSEDGGRTWDYVTELECSQTNYKVQNLTSGHTYEFRIIAVNAVGRSDPLFSEPIEPADKPLPPGGPISCTCTSESSVALRWNPSRSEGVSSPLKYVIEKRKVDTTAWTGVDIVSADKLTCTASDLTKDVTYIFQVQALNGFGCSDPLQSEEVIVRRPTGVSTAPVGPIKFSRVKSDSVTLAWSLPYSDGGTPVKHHRVEMSEDDGNSWHVMKSEVTGTVYTQEDLTRGKRYKFRVTAVNAVGQSEALESESVEPVDLPSPPEGPLSVSKVNENSAVLTWKPSKSDGGSSLHGYVIEKREERRDVWTVVDEVDAETLAVKAIGLIEGRAYFFRVTARNEKGSSNPLESAEAVTPKKPAVAPEKPAGPIKFNKVESDSIVLAWSAPVKDGGSPVTSYTVELTDDGKTWQQVASVRRTFCMATGLAETQKYKFRVYAVNAMGVSEPLVSGDVTTTKKKDDRPHQTIHNHNPVVNIAEVKTMIIADTIQDASAGSATDRSNPLSTVLFTDSPHDPDEDPPHDPDQDSEQTRRKEPYGEAGDSEEAAPLLAKEKTRDISLHQKPQNL